MRYAVVSAVVTDEIHFADGREKIVPGGAGIYAMCGIRLWEDDVQVVTGVGEDYRALHGAWYEKNHISMDGLKVKDEKSVYTFVRYFEDGEREETPRYGLSHFRKLETAGEEMKPVFDTFDGIYIFKNTDEAFWRETLKACKDYTGKVMWEIAADAALWENRKKVEEIAKQMNGFSINMTEAKNLFGTDSREEIIEHLKSWGIELVFLRQGAKGAVMISRTKTIEVGPEPGVKVEDPTGGGNSSTGGVLCGLVNGYSPEVCGRMGSISAAMCISQYGVPEEITEEMRIKAFRKAGIEV